MSLHIKLQEKSEIPLYRQIADAIYREIITGGLSSGEKLPTVRELSDEMGISKGTIKHAYEHLGRQGAIEMIQGRGSFVLSTEEDTSSRKEKAMTAIDRLFSEMEDLGFTPKEIEIYFRLKLQGLEEKYDLVKAAIVDCNPETIRQTEEQLSGIELLETASFPLKRISEVCGKLNREYDIILTTPTHFAEVEAALRDRNRLAMLSMAPAKETLILLARLSDEEKAGIIAGSSIFVNIIRESCRGMGAWGAEVPGMLFGNGKEMEEFLKDKTTIIVPKYFESFASSAEAAMLRHFERDGGKVICYNYVVDRGSFLYVEQLVKKTLNKKRSI